MTDDLDPTAALVPILIGIVVLTDERLPDEIHEADHRPPLVAGGRPDVPATLFDAALASIGYTPSSGALSGTPIVVVCGDHRIEREVASAFAAVYGARVVAARRESHHGTLALLVERCQYVLALSPPVPNGGTAAASSVAELVEWLREERLPAAQSRATSSHGFGAAPLAAVVRIDVRGNTVEPLVSAAQAARTAALCAAIAGHNEDVRDMLRRRGDAPLRESRTDLLQGMVAPDVLAASGLSRVVVAYAAADAIAVERQREYQRTVRQIYVLFTAALWLFAFVSIQRFFVAAHVVAIPLIWLLVRHARARRLEDRFLDARVVAEGLRVLAFWRIGGVRGEVAAHYMTKHAQLLAWARQAIGNVETAAPATEEAPVDQTRLALARALWVDDQQAYYRRKAAALDRDDARLARRARLSFAATMAAAVAYLGYAVGVALGVLPERGVVDNAFETVLALAGAMGVTAQAYRGALALEDTERLYAAGASLFAAAQAQLDDVDVDATAVLERLGKETLAEHGDWYWLRRNSAIDVPR